MGVFGLFRAGAPSRPPVPSLTASASAPAWHDGGTRRAPSSLAAHIGQGWYVREEAVMGTAVRVELWCASGRTAVKALDAVMAEMHRIDRAMSPHKPDSELSRVNRDAAGAPVRVSDEMFALLERALHFSALSDGAFDITYASAGQLYDHRRRIRPDLPSLEQARAAIGWRGLRLDAATHQVRFARPGMRIDLGGFAKGHAVDRGAAILRGFGIEHALVSAGGDSRVVGDRRGRPWTIAVRHPRAADEVVAVLPLEDVAVSTSGDYERYFIDAAGRRCHHLLDPRTGAPAESVHSVTIVAPDGLTSEGLSKSVFVLGVERGLALVNALPDVDAVVVDAAGALHHSAGWLAGGSLSREAS